MKFTSQDLQSHVHSGTYINTAGSTRDTAKAIVCADGFHVSAQASKYHYCSPRNNEGPYDTIELGFPSEEVSQWMEYAEDSEFPTETVYGQVPVDLVVEVINQHGGLKA